MLERSDIILFIAFTHLIANNFKIKFLQLNINNMRPSEVLNLGNVKNNNSTM